jgi:hypothetical protein
LHLGLAGASTSSEDVEDELRTIHDANTDAILEGFTLCRCELVVEDHEIRLGTGHTFTKLVDLALSDVEAGMGGIDPLADDVDDLTTCGVGQSGQLLEMFLGDALMEALQGSPHEDRPFHGRAVVDQLGRNVAS